MGTLIPTLTERDMPPSSTTDLATILLEIAGGEACDLETVATLGPGLLYLLELPSYRIAYFDRATEDFPPAFHKLLDSVDSWPDVLSDADQSAYRADTSHASFQPESDYTIQLNRRGETAPVKDYRRLVRNSLGQPVAILGRIVDESFRSVAFDSLARRSWKEIATTMTRRYLHDFNNTIAGIYSLSELYAEPGSDPKSMTEAMGHIRDCSIRAQDLTKKIRHLTMLETGAEELHDLRSLIQDQVQYMEALLPKGAEISLSLDENDHPIRLDANQFRQVALHLTGNASDAGGDDARISIRLSREDRPAQSPLAIIEFRDYGPGFSSLHLEQGHLPFFTTKDKSKHPGLGLSIAHDFTKKLGGSLELDNAAPGAVVRIKIPLLEDGRSATATPPKAPAIASAPASAAPRPTAGQPCNLHIYTWEDISRHPLLLELQKHGWDIQVHLDPRDLLIALAQRRSPSTGILIFKNPLDERVDPLLYELGNAKNCPKLALLSLGESPDLVPESIKRICGLIAAGSSKPSVLSKQLAKFFA